MTIAYLAAQLIQSFEGFRPVAYYDPYGKMWTIGWGHTLNVKEGDTCTRTLALSYLESDLAPLLAKVVGRNPFEAAAMCSFGFNLGAHALDRLISGDITVSDAGFSAGGVRYGYTSGGVELAGLVVRRGLESAIIMTYRQMSIGANT